MRQGLELIPVESMDQVFDVALHRVILPQRIAGNYVIEIEDDDDEEEIEIEIQSDGDGHDQPHLGASTPKRGRRS